MANEDKKDFNAMLMDSKDMPKVQIITDEKSIEKYGGDKMYFAPPIDYDKVMRLVPCGKLLTVGTIRDYFESNFQRSEILPSEKAFAYKMRLEAMKRQAGRPTKNNLVPVGQNYSREELAAQSGESQTQIQRYIRLTNLVPELLEFVDEGRIKMRPAVELSYLDEDCQRDVVDEIDLNDATPSHDQTIRMRKLFNEGNLTTGNINNLFRA